jgi:hypothetical protein
MIPNKIKRPGTLDKGAILDIVDLSYVAHKMVRYVNIGLLSVQDDPAERSTMSTIVIIIGVLPSRPPRDTSEMVSL